MKWKLIQLQSRAVCPHCERFHDRKNVNNRSNIGDDWYWPKFKRIKLNLSPWQYSKLKLDFAYWQIDRNYLIHMIWCLCDSSPILFLSYEGVTYYGNGYSVYDCRYVQNCSSILQWSKSLAKLPEDGLWMFKNDATFSFMPQIIQQLCCYHVTTS